MRPSLPPTGQGSGLGWKDERASNVGHGEGPPLRDRALNVRAGGWARELEQSPGLGAKILHDSPRSPDFAAQRETHGP